MGSKILEQEVQGSYIINQFQQILNPKYIGIVEIFMLITVFTSKEHNLLNHIVVAIQIN